MKAFVMLLGILGFSASAFAAKYSCELVNAGEDFEEYAVEINTDSKAAALFDNDSWTTVKENSSAKIPTAAGTIYGSAKDDVQVFLDTSEGAKNESYVSFDVSEGAKTKRLKFSIKCTPTNSLSSEI